MSDRSQRVFSTEFKVRLVQRIEAGERVSALVAETGVLRKSLYQWRAAYRALGVAGLDRKRGPKPGGKRNAAAAKPVDELARAKARIAELERVIGRQQADLHFFREASRLWDAKHRGGDAPASTKSSKK